MGAAEVKLLKGVARSFCISLFVTVVAMMAAVVVAGWWEGSARERRLQQEVQKHSIEPPGKGLNVQDPKALKELRESGIPP